MQDCHEAPELVGVGNATPAIFKIDFSHLAQTATYSFYPLIVYNFPESCRPDRLPCPSQ